MASVKRWMLVTLAACMAVALAYLPPRGSAQRRSHFFAARSPEGTPARRRAQALADEWRGLAAMRRLLDERAALAEQLRHDATLDRPIFVLRSSATAPPARAVAHRRVEQALDSAWRILGLGETKIRVGVVIDLWPASAPVGAPAPDRGGATYLEPDSTNRTLCVALVPASAHWTRAMTADSGDRSVPPLAGWLRDALGPCAFYAAFGAPGIPVRRWLAARAWDIALQPPAPGERGPTHSPSVWLGADPRFGWYWARVYTFPSATVGCLAGRAASCRAAVMHGSHGAPADRPGIVQVDRRWWRAQWLVPASRYLSDVAADVGRDRFQSFWTTTEPVDTALSVALREPVGEWTRRWQQRFVPPIRLGAAAPLGSALISLVLAIVAVSAVAGAAVRRQVR